MKTYCSRRLANVALVVVLAFGAVRAADATVIIGGSAGDGATVSLTFTPVIGSALTASAGPFPSASGLAPPPYSVSASASDRSSFNP